VLIFPASLADEQKKAGAVVPLDLSGFYQQIWSDLDPEKSWAALPRGLQILRDVPFQIGGRLEVTGMQFARNRNFRPTRIMGIPVGRKASRIHLLHATGGAVEDRTPVAKVVLHYANGAQRSLPILYGVHVRNWWADRAEQRDELSDPRSQVAWTGTSQESDLQDASLRLFRTSFMGPLPDEEIKTLDIVTFFSEAMYALVAISVDESGATPAGKDSDLTAAAQETNESVWRKEMTVRLVDTADGKPLAGVVVKAMAKDQNGMMQWGSYTSDAEGRVDIDYPPNRLSLLQLQVGAREHLPIRATSPASNGFPAELTVKLQRGTNIGGTVRDTEGKPVAGAQILINSVARDLAGEFYLAESAPLFTDRDGRWSASCVPTNFTKLTFSLSHSNFVTAEYDQAPSDSGTPYVVAAEDLLARTAVMELAAGLEVEGTVTDETGKLLANAEVTLAFGARSSESQKTFAIAGDGRFRFRALEPGEGSLLVEATGFAPYLSDLKIDPDMKPLRVALKKGMMLRGRVVDQETKPVKGASIAVWSWNGRPWFNWRAETDELGRFQWESAPEGTVRCSVSKPGFDLLRHWDLTACGDEVTLTLSRMAMVSGTVIDAQTREPIKRFIFIEGRSYGYSYGPGDQIRWERQTARTGVNGHFSFRPSDQTSKVLIEAEGYLPKASPPFAKSGAFTFELKRGKGISGVVTLPNGQPVAGATVLLVDSSEGAYMDKPGEFRADIYHLQEQ